MGDHEMWVCSMDSAVMTLPDHIKDVQTDLKVNIPKEVNKVLTSRMEGKEAKGNSILRRLLPLPSLTLPPAPRPELYDKFLQPILDHITTWLNTPHPIYDEVDAA